MELLNSIQKCINLKQQAILDFNNSIKSLDLSTLTHEEVMQVFELVEGELPCYGWTTPKELDMLLKELGFNYYVDFNLEKYSTTPYSTLIEIVYQWELEDDCKEAHQILEWAKTDTHEEAFKLFSCEIAKICLKTQSGSFTFNW